MGELGKRPFKFSLCFMASFLVGILIGVTVLSVVVSYRMDNYYKQISYLKNIIQDRDERLEKLEKSINTQNLIVKGIEVSLIFDKDKNNDKIDEIEIEKTIKEKYNALLGKEVKNIDAQMIAEVVDKRILKIEDREYKLKMDKLILTEILNIYIKVEQTG